MKYLEILKRHNIILIVLICILIAANILLYEVKKKGNEAPAQVYEQPAVTRVIFEPKNITVAKDQDFVVQVKVDPADHKVSNLDLNLNFDSSKLKLNSIEQSNNFPQVLQSKIYEGGADFSAAAPFGLNITSVALYATLHFHSLATTTNSELLINNKKSGVYTDDAPGVNNLNQLDVANIVITD